MDHVDSDESLQITTLGYWWSGEILFDDSSILQGGACACLSTYSIAYCMQKKKKKAHGAIIVCDSSRLPTLEVGAERWRADISAKLDRPPVPVILAVNKVKYLFKSSISSN